MLASAIGSYVGVPERRQRADAPRRLVLAGDSGIATRTDPIQLLTPYIRLLHTLLRAPTIKLTPQLAL